MSQEICDVFRDGGRIYFRCTDGSSVSLPDAARAAGVQPSTLRERVKRGVPLGRILAPANSRHDRLDVPLDQDFEALVYMHVARREYENGQRRRTGMTCDEIAKALGCSRQAINQVEAQALRKLAVGDYADFLHDLLEASLEAEPRREHWSDHLGFRANEDLRLTGDAPAADEFNPWGGER
ncbi:MAG: sigma factor-like helix-turn-helix DNA-binding protein [Myxococcota bacterium]